MRKIIHLDMDCFYAAVEMRERPELAGRPIAVGGGSARGVVTTCNYEARKFGVRSAMPGFRARELCPGIVFLPVRFELYREESRRIRRILLDVTPLVEPLSLDEAYLDVTAIPRFAWDLAKEIRRRILETTGLTASAGVAPNKMLAKIASDWRKPNGQFAILPEDVEAFLRELPVGKLWGVGPKGVARFEREGILTCGDLQKLSRNGLIQRHGKWGAELFDLCRGRDDRAVEPNRVRKSLSTERTFQQNLRSISELRANLAALVGELLEEVRTKARDRVLRKAFVKVKFSDFSRCSRECLSADPSLETFLTLLDSALGSAPEQPIRLLGVGVRFAETSGSEEATHPSLPLDFR